MNEAHKPEPAHGPIGRAHLFDKCADCGQSITRITNTGKVGLWRHTK